MKLKLKKKHDVDLDWKTTTDVYPKTVYDEKASRRLPTLPYFYDGMSM